MGLGRFLDELLDKTVVLSYTNVGYRLRKPCRSAMEPGSMQGKVCAVTGANSGLGKAASRRLAALGATVLLLCRNAQRGEAARREIVAESGNEQVWLEIVDLSSQASIRACAARLPKRTGRLDVLVNNAGVLLDERQASVDGIEMTFATNTLGPFLLTTLLLPLLRASAPARVVNVSSGGMYLARLHVDDLQFEHRPYDGVRAYAETKRAEVVLAQRWAEAWAGTGVAAHAMHPGWADTPGVRTSLPTFLKWMRPLLRTPAQGADTIVWLAAASELAGAASGQFWFDRQARPVHKLGVRRNTPEDLDRFWQRCHELVR